MYWKIEQFKKTVEDTNFILEAEQPSAPFQSEQPDYHQGGGFFKGLAGLARGFLQNRANQNSEQQYLQQFPEMMKNLYNEFMQYVPQAGQKPDPGNIQNMKYTYDEFVTKWREFQKHYKMSPPQYYAAAAKQQRMQQTQQRPVQKPQQRPGVPTGPYGQQRESQQNRWDILAEAADFMAVSQQLQKMMSDINQNSKYLKGQLGDYSYDWNSNEVMRGMQTVSSRTGVKNPEALMKRIKKMLSTEEGAYALSHAIAGALRKEKTDKLRQKRDQATAQVPQQQPAQQSQILDPSGQPVRQ